MMKNFLINDSYEEETNRYSEMKAQLSKDNNFFHIGVGKALKIELNEFRVDQAVIVRAPVMAVRTESGFSFEVVTDTGAEVNIIAESVARDLGI